MGHLPGDPMGEAMSVATEAAFTDAMRQALLAATVIALVTATVVSLAVAARIARPISALAAAARRLAGGHYAERVPVEEPAELGELAASFNEMAGSLEATERRRLQLVGDVAHELRTPLTTLDGYLEGLEGGGVEPSAALWRPDPRQLPLRTEAVDLSALPLAVAEQYAPVARARAIEIETSGTGSPGTAAPGTAATALADRDRVAQIVGNYLSNAIRHAPDGSTIRVSTTVTPTR